VEDAAVLVDALGGVGNVTEVEPCSPRIRIEVRDPFLVDEPGLRRPGVLAVVRSGDVVQLVVGRGADEAAAALARSLSAVRGAGGSAPMDAATS
jgi:phosphotransferase system IIB component